jgi:hypothetical protein
LEINPNYVDALYYRRASKVRNNNVKSGLEDLSNAIKIDKIYVNSARQDNILEI